VEPGRFLALLGESVGIWSRADVNGNDEYWSPRFYELLGYEVGEIPSTLEQFKELLHPDDHARTFTMVDGHFAGECDFDVKYRVRTKSKGYRWFRGAGSVSRAADGSPLRMVGSIMYIDAGERAITSLQTLNEDLEHFIQIAAHDLREPARRQLMLADLILEDHEGALDDDLQRMLIESQKQSRRTLDLLGAEIRIDLPEVAHTHWSVLRLLLHTLVSNAVRHSSAGLELGVGSFLRGEQECYFVENTWVTTHRSPESFVQTERGETAADRFGMRLGLCKRAALVLGGDLWLAPTVEKFRVEFTLGKTK